MILDKYKNNPILYFFWSVFSYAFTKIKMIKTIIYSSYYSLVYFRSFRVVFVNHLTIGLEKLAAARVIFPHPVGIVIGKGVKIGNKCTVYQNVTIGSKNNLGQNYPKIGDNVTIYANSCIFGDVIIGDNVIIGACSLINKDIPSNSIVAGNPAKIIGKINK